MPEEEFVQSSCASCHRALWEKDGPVCQDCLAEQAEATKSAPVVAPLSGVHDSENTGSGSDEPEKRVPRTGR